MEGNFRPDPSKVICNLTTLCLILFMRFFAFEFAEIILIDSLQKPI